MADPVDWKQIGELAADLGLVARVPGRNEEGREKLAAILLFALIGSFGAERLDRYALPSGHDEEDPDATGG